MWTWRGSLSGALAAQTQDHELADLSAEWMETGVAMSEAFTLPWQVYCRLLAVSGLTSLMRGDAAVGHLEAAVPLADQIEGYDTLRRGRVASCPSTALWTATLMPASRSLRASWDLRTDPFRGERVP